MAKAEWQDHIVVLPEAWAEAQGCPFEHDGTLDRTLKGLLAYAKLKADPANALKPDEYLAAQAGLGGATINTAYSQLVTQLGSDVRDATQTTDNATILAGSLDDKRQSVSGVSLDEELLNLTMYQRAFQGSAKLVNAASDMLDIVLGMVRLNGQRPVTD